MPFDPAKPQPGDDLDADLVRAQLNALKALIDAPMVPGPAVIGGASAGSGGSFGLSALTADRATGFDVFLKGPADAAFGVVAMGAGDAYEFDGLAPGDYAARVAGRNAAGVGVWSEATPFTI